MFSGTECILTTKDFQILQSLLDERTPFGDPLARLLRAKLSSPHLVLPADVPPDVATLYSRVQFSADDGPSAVRTLIRDEAYGIPGGSLPITNMRGLALLGLGAGRSIAVPDPGGVAETLRMETVLYQPEAAQRWRAGTVRVS